MRTLSLLLLTVVFARFAGAQSSGAGISAWDSSGNNLLNGTYNFRHVIYRTTSATGRIGTKRLQYGKITFDGRGAYVVNGTLVQSGEPPVATPMTVRGTYEIAASGLGSMKNPASDGDTLYGLVSRGVFIGCSTESDFTDLMIAAPSSGLGISLFQGRYHLTGFDVPTSDAASIHDSWYEINPDGSGNLGNVNVSGYVAGQGSKIITQTRPGGKYTFASGLGTLSFPASSLPGTSLISDAQSLYVSTDGSFVFGGSPTAFDMFVGVRASSPSSPMTHDSFAGLYYQAGIDQDASEISSGISGLYNYYGSLAAIRGVQVNHQRINSLGFPSAFDYTSSDNYMLSSDGVSNDSFQKYWVGAGGVFRVGVGTGPYLGINIAVKAPAFTGTGVYINPAGITNAANSAPFTAGLSPGELVTLYGSELARNVVINYASPAPTLLDGSQVLVNGIAAPLTFVSPRQINFIAPYSTQTIASIQVMNVDVLSNTVTSFMNLTSAGVFTNPPGGIALAAAVHPNGAAVTESNPAQVGEALALFVGGLGKVNPTIPTGSAGGVTTLNRAIDEIRAFIDRKPATVTYAGLAPYLHGCYQVNLVVPAGTRSGKVFVDIAGSDSDHSGAYIVVAPGPGTAGASGELQPSSRPMNLSNAATEGRSQSLRLGYRSFPQ